MNTALVEALREKFPSAKAALRAMGLDETLLDADTGKDSLADKVMRILVRRYGTQRAALRKLGMDASLLDEPEHMRSDPRGGTGGTWREGADKFGLRSSSRDNIPPKIETNEEDLSRDEDLSEEEERALQEHAAKMREEGMDSRVIDSAMRMARDVLRGNARVMKVPDAPSWRPWADRGSEAHDFELNSPEVGRGVAPPQGLDSRRRSGKFTAS